jgi:TRAP-type C4-dicarboxylate transport system permease large subunit
MMSAVEEHLPERADDSTIQERYKMPDNTHNKRMFTIWHLTAAVVAVGGMIVEVLTPNTNPGLVGVVIAMIILFSAKRRYGTGTFDERTMEIHRKAASAVFGLTAVGLLIIWLLNRYLRPVIGAMSGEEVSDDMGSLILLMLCCYLGFYFYYRWSV